VSSSAIPGNRGATILSGHRDTHFRFLAHVRPGDQVIIEMPAKERYRYRVIRTEVVDARTATVATGFDGALVLVTCYPFDSIISGGPFRYIVTAESR
jgi:sortase A